MNTVRMLSTVTVIVDYVVVMYGHHGPSPGVAQQREPDPVTVHPP